MTVDEVNTALVNAFPAPPLNPDGAFSDWGATYGEGDEFAVGTRGRDWRALEAPFLEWHHDAVNALGPVFFAKMLPAFLSALVNHLPELDKLPDFVIAALTRSSSDHERQKRFDARIAALTASQKATVAHILESLESNVIDETTRAEIGHALDSYWREVAR